MADNGDKRLFLLDAYALIYRAYYAFIKNPRVNSKGMNTSAVFGFTNTLNELIKKEQPSHIAVVFDPEGPVGRVEDYTEYKANREKQPEDITLSIPYIKQIVRGFRIPTLMVDGYEADDVIGTLAKKAEKEGYTVYMMTPDKDYAQLVSDHIFMYKPGRQGNDVEIWGLDEVKKKFEVERADQVIDFLGMMGDSVDNIPGIPGVGEKTAKKFIKEYGSIEGLYENVDQLKGKLKEKVADARDQAMMSKHLATIILDVPIEFDEEDLTREQPDGDVLKEIFEELEFRTLGERILGEKIEVNATAPSNNNGQTDLFSQPGEAIDAPNTGMDALQTIDDVEVDYQLMDTAEKRAELVKKLQQQKSFCFDTETTSLDAHNADLVGIAFSWKKHEAYYVPCPVDREETMDILSEFRPVFENENIEKVGQNIKYDLVVLLHYGLRVRGPIFDTMIAHYLINPEMRHNMDILAETYLSYTPVSIEELIGKKGKNQGNMRDVPVEKVVRYAGEDADITWQLSEIFKPALEKVGAEELYRDIEAPLIPVLADMEVSGVKLDREALDEIAVDLKKEIDETEKKIFELAGHEFNVGSPKQLGVVLFDEMNIVDKPKKTKSGQYSTSEDVLSKIEDAHEIVPLVLDYRSTTKLLSTYVEALPELVHPKTGRIHTTFNQAVAATGRLSSTSPNLQNIPIRTERGRLIRKAFTSRGEDYVFLAADYSQIELRIVAALSGDESMIDAFNAGKDIHAATAAKVYDVPLDEVTREMRSRAKMVNFGIIYGISAFGLADRLNIKRTEASEIINNYFEKYPKIKQYMDESIDKARDKGYVTTVMGRRRYLPDINSRNRTVRGFAERNAINAPIQGSAADIIKKAMIDIGAEMDKKDYKSKMVLQVHDELVFDVHRDEEAELTEMIVDKMENAYKMNVPLTVEVGTGANWLEAH